MDWITFTIGFVSTALVIIAFIGWHVGLKRVNAAHLTTLKTLEIYRERNAQLEKFESELKDAQLKMKVMQMLIDDDEAIDELLSASKGKSIPGDLMYVDPRYGLRSAAQAQAQANMAIAQGMSLAGLSGLAGGQPNIFN